MPGNLTHKTDKWHDAWELTCNTVSCSQPELKQDFAPLNIQQQKVLLIY